MLTINKINKSLQSRLNINELKIHFIRLKSYGDAILLQYYDKNIMIDFGHPEESELILNYLRRYNVNKLDYIIISHYHEDHTGGLEAVINNIDCTDCTVFLPCEPDFNRFMINGNEFRQKTESIYSLIDNKGITRRIPNEDEIINIGELQIKFNNCSSGMFENYYNVTHEYTTDGSTDYNNFSLVATLIHDDVKMFLSGDINVAAQENLVNKIGKVFVYKTEHHSVNSNSCVEFLNELNPEIAIACNNNQPSLPESLTTAYMINNNKEYYVTYQSGDVVLISDGNHVTVESNNNRYAASEANIFNSFKQAYINYDKDTTDLLTVIKAMDAGTLNANLIYGTPVCPDFISTWGGLIEVFKATANKATIRITDGNPSKHLVYDGVWHSAKPDKIFWHDNIGVYTEFHQVYPDYDDTTTDLITIITNMKENMFLRTRLVHGKAVCPDFVSTWGGALEIFKATNNRATVRIEDHNYNRPKVYNGIWHIDYVDGIKWFEDKEPDILTFNDFYKVVDNYSDETTTLIDVIKAMPAKSIVRTDAVYGRATCPDFISSWSGIIEIFKSTANKATLTIHDMNPSKFKAYEGIWHSSNSEEITWTETSAASSVGSLSSLQTNNKDNLVNAINEVFQSGVNAKQGLVDALNANGESCSTSDTWETLINKVSNSGGGGLDIIAATSLPAAGKENQICIISNDPNYDVLVTTNFNESLTDPTFLVYLGNTASADADLGTQLQIGNMMYYFNKVCFGSDRLASYYYANNTWNQLTVAKILIYENLKFHNADIFGSFTSGQQTAGVFWYNSSTTLTKSYNGSYHVANSFSKKINFSLYNTIEVFAKKDSNYFDTPAFAIAATNTKYSNTTTGTANMLDAYAPVKSATKNIATTTAYVSNKFDISSWTGEYYLTLVASALGSFTISAIYIY